MFFDLDRTLWDFDFNSRETLLEMYHAFSLKIYTRDFYTFYRTFQGVNDDIWLRYRNKEITKQELRWKRFYLTLKPFDVKDRAIADKLDDYYVTNSPLKNKLFPNTIETLQKIDEKFHKYILTNGFSEVQFIKLESCGLSNYFEKVYTSEEIGVQKPGIEFFEYVLNDLAVNANSCLMIGDDCNSDIMGAKSCQIDQVYFNPERIKPKCEATFEIANLSELLPILNIVTF